jgi:phage terminase small subunit
MPEKTSENRTNSNNTELSRKQETFIAAMMTLPTIEAASRAAGVTSKTARLWMKQPHIQEAYKAAKQAVFEETLEGLRDCTKEAIDTLRSNLKAIDPAVQVRAAHILLTQAVQLYKYEEVEAAVKELKDALEGQGK